MNAAFGRKLIDLKKAVYDNNIFQELAQQLKENLGSDEDAVEAYQLADTMGKGARYLKDIYSVSIADYETELTRYFDKLYDVLCFLETAHDDTHELTNILIRQLTNDELYIIFYHGISGYHTHKFLRLVDHFQVLRHIPVETNQLLELNKRYYANTTFVYQYYSNMPTTN